MTITTRDNFAMTSANLGITSNVALLRVRSNNITNVAIDGRAFALASTDDLWVLAGTALAVQQTCAFFLFLSITGVATVEQSAIVAASTAQSPAARSYSKETSHVAQASPALRCSTERVLR